MQNVETDFRLFTDDELVPQSQEGNDLAFTELIRRYRPSSMKLAMSILKDRCEAEDQVQNALWKAFEHIGQFNREAKFSTWLTRIVVNQCLMRLRQAKRARVVYLEDALTTEENLVLELPDHAPDPETILGKSEVSNLLSKEIRRIPPLLRDVFLLRDVHDLPMGEVATRLGISIAAAKSRLLRARLELRSRLLKHQGRLGPATLTA